VGIRIIIPVGTSIAKKIQGVEPTAHVNPASVPVEPIVIKSNALLPSMICAMESLTPMERTGDLKDATETIRIIQTFKCTIRLCIVILSNASLMEERTDHAIVRCIKPCVRSLATSESTT